ncbi:hypothetical protein evm_007917 [Chilo suppressalis]|nr:hypothetical protein evm_007917 [Chilo suppressalis]
MKKLSSNTEEHQFYDCLNVNENLNEIRKSLVPTEVSNKRILTYGFAKPTKQWNMKCNALKDPLLRELNIENKSKRGTPAWRLVLQEY